MLQISKDTLSNSTEALQISKDTLSNSTEEKIQTLTKELAELVIQFKALEQKVNDNDQVFSTDSLTALTGTIKDLFSTNIESDVFNSDKHSFSSGLEAQYLTIQPGTIVYAHNDSSYILVIWLSSETYIVITPDKYLWQINRDFTISLPSGDTFLFSYIGTGASNVETTLSEALRLFNNGCTIKGALNYGVHGVTEFPEGIIVKKLLQVKGQSAFNGDIDIDGNVTITGDINLKKNLNVERNITSNGALTVKGDIKASSNAEINGALTVKGDIIQQGSSYETHAEKLYTKNNLIFTRDGAVSALTDNEITGIQAKLYNGTNDGQLVFSKDGVARVGDVGDLQPLATREENPTNGAVAVWDSTDKRFKTKPFDTTPTAGSTNPVTSGGVKSALTKSNVGLGNVTNVATESTITSGSSKNITSGAVYSALANRGRFYTASCSTASSAQKKAISISNYTLVAGDIIGVTFTNANTYGDCTASTKTYPLLYINRGSSYYTMTICDSRGNSCGTGCWNAGNYIEFRVISSTKVCIINSDVRQSVSGTINYIIYSNNKIRQYGVATGSKVSFPISFKNTTYALIITLFYKGNAEECYYVYDKNTSYFQWHYNSEARDDLSISYIAEGNL